MTQETVGAKMTALVDCPYVYMGYQGERAGWRFAQGDGTTPIAVPFGHLRPSEADGILAP
jgi:hypothetical protein